MRVWTRRWIALLALAAAAAVAALGAAGQAAPGDGPVLFASGLAVVEAEDHDAKAARSAHDWTAGAGPAGLVGASIQATPDNGARITASIGTTSPEVGYRVLFPSAGTFQLWVRAFGIANGNTLHAGRDGQVTAQNIAHTVGSWTWRKVALAVPSAGEHTVQLWMREDGLHVDRLLLAQSASFTPTGTGPAVTGRQPTGPDTTPPTLTGRQPAPGATGVAVGANVVATFSEAMNPASVGASSFSLAPTAGGPAVAASIGASAGNTVFTLNPSADLAPATQYTATVTTAAEDAAGNDLAAQQTWSFTTAAAPEPGDGAVTFASGLAVVEAEDHDAKVARSAHDWMAGAGPAGAVGSAIQATPDTGARITAAIPTTAPEVGYRVLFPAAGTYQLWVRGNGLSNGNTLHQGRDGTVTAENVAFATGSWTWLKRAIAIPSAGEHVIKLWMREDGMRVDRLLVAESAGFTPTGSGPAVTPRDDGSTPAFAKVTLPTASGAQFTTVARGPDGKLYAGALDGTIRRWTIQGDGTLGAAETLTSLQTAEGGARHVLGIAFDPAATAGSLVLWVSHGTPGFDSEPDWSGKITRLSGPSLGTVQDAVVGLPRSVRDHAGNGIAFGPDGALYLAQGGNTEMGAAAADWENRPERLLSAAVLRIDTAAIGASTVDARTAEGGTYDPFAAGAPVTLHATGFRNSYDLVWDTAGRLYVSGNGGSAGGLTPATPSSLPASCTSRIDDATAGDYTGPAVPGITSPVAQPDHLFRVAAGGYYGHPNPARCEWVMNGGNPTAGADPAEVAQYPVGTLPDRNYRGIAYDFGSHRSPNGIIEYRGGAFEGALQGALIVARYSQGDDLIVLEPGPSGDIASARTGLAGLTGFSNPVDLVEDRATGNIYVAEIGAQRITLLRPAGG